MHAIIDAVLDGLKTLTPNKLCMLFGAILVAAYWVDPGEDLVVFGVGIALFLLGVLLSILRAQANERTQLRDLEYRQKLIDEGLVKDVKDDKTRIKVKK